MKLYELKSEYEAVMAKIEAYAAEHEGEIPPEMDTELDAIGADIEEKLQNCGMAYKGMVAEAEAIHEEERKLAARRGVLEHRAEWLRNYMAAHVGAGAKYTFPQVSLRSARSEAVDVYDAAALPDNFRRVTVAPDKAEIRAAVRQGLAVPGARVVERWNLQIK